MTDRGTDVRPRRGVGVRRRGELDRSEPRSEQHQSAARLGSPVGSAVRHLVSDLVSRRLENSEERPKGSGACERRYVLHRDDVGTRPIDERREAVDRSPSRTVRVRRDASGVGREWLTGRTADENPDFGLCPRGAHIVGAVVSNVLGAEPCPRIGFVRIPTPLIHVDPFHDVQAGPLEPIREATGAAEQVDDSRVVHPADSIRTTPYGERTQPPRKPRTLRSALVRSAPRHERTSSVSGPAGKRQCAGQWSATGPVITVGPPPRRPRTTDSTWIDP